MSHFERVMEGLRFGTPLHASVVTKNLVVSTQLDALQARWSVQLKPALEEVLAGNVAPTAAQTYVQQADEYVAGWDQLIQLIEHEAAARLHKLRSRQIWFLIVFLTLIGVTTLLFNRHRLDRPEPLPGL